MYFIKDARNFCFVFFSVDEIRLLNVTYSIILNYQTIKSICNEVKSALKTFANEIYVETPKQIDGQFYVRKYVLIVI